MSCVTESGRDWSDTIEINNNCAKLSKILKLSKYTSHCAPVNYLKLITSLSKIIKTSELQWQILEIIFGAASTTTTTITTVAAPPTTTACHSKVVTANVSYLLEPQQLPPLITNADDRTIVTIVVVVIIITIISLHRVVVVTVLVISSVLTVVAGVSTVPVNSITAHHQVKTPSLSAASISREC